MHKIDKKYLTIEKLHEIVHEQHKIELSKSSIKRILDCRSFLDKQSDFNIPIYGVNTGFGSLCNEFIPKEKIEEIQLNLVISHACGFGEEVPSHIV